MSLVTGEGGSRHGLCVYLSIIRLHHGVKISRGKFKNGSKNVVLGILHSGKPNTIEGKLIWFSLLFHPVLACYGCKMVAKKEKGLNLRPFLSLSCYPFAASIT